MIRAISKLSLEIAHKRAVLPYFFVFRMYRLFQVSAVQSKNIFLRDGDIAYRRLQINISFLMRQKRQDNIGAIFIGSHYKGCESILYECVQM